MVGSVQDSYQLHARRMAKARELGLSLPSRLCAPCLAQVAAVRDGAAQELGRLRAELASASARARDLAAERDALEQSLARASDAARAAEREADELRGALTAARRARDDLDRAHADLDQRLQAALEDQRRMGLVMQGMEAAKQGLQRRLSCYESPSGSGGGGGGTSPGGSPIPRMSPLGPANVVGGGGGAAASPARDSIAALGPRAASPAAGSPPGPWRQSAAVSLAVPGLSTSPGGGGLTDSILAANLSNIQVGQ